MDRIASLTVFARVAEAKGFSAAARHLGMSTTMVSNHVQALEERLGVRLLNRTTRRVALTEVGRAYYERCVRILDELREADDAAGLLQTTASGTLRLYAGTHIMPFLTPAIVEFLRDHPEASVDLTTGERAVDLVEERFDLAIRGVHPSDGSMIVRSLAEWHDVLVCAPSYLVQHDAPRRPEDLRQHNCLRYSLYPSGDEWKFIGPNETPVSVKVTGRLATNNVATLQAAMLDGQGIVMAPTFIAQRALAAGIVVRLLADYRGITSVISASYPTRHHLSAKVRVFLDLAAEHFARHRTEIDPA